MNFLRVTICLFVISIVISGTVAVGQDWAFARDETSKPIDTKTDMIVVSLGTSRLPIKDNFLAKVKEAGAIIQITVTGSVGKNTTAGGAAQPENQSRAFPFGFRATVEKDHGQVVNLPFQATPVGGLKLTDKLDEGTVEYKNLAIDVTMVRLDQKKPWTKILQRLIGLGQAANLPVSPFGTIAKYALDFANSTLADALEDAGTEKDVKLPLGIRTLNFKVKEHPAETGTYLLILPPVSNHAQTNPGDVNPNDLSQVCLRRQLGAGDTIMVGRKKTPDAADCPATSFVPLANPYVPIILETEVVRNVPSRELEAAISGKLAHCRMANLSPADCKQLLTGGRSQD